MKNKVFNSLVKKIIIFTFLGLLVSCNKDDKVGSESFNLSTFSGVIEQGEGFESFPQSRETNILAETSSNDDVEVKQEDGSTDTQRFVCTTKTVSVLDGNDQFQLFGTSADVIYPGSLLQGKTLDDSTPAPIVVKRAGGTISYNLNNGNLQSSFTVDEVKKSTIQDAINNIISNSGDVVPANFQLDIIQVESESQLALELGIDVETFSAKVSADMSFSSEKVFNRTLVKLNQSYYTMSFDLPTSTDEIFHESVTPEQLNNFIQPDNPGTFISSVTFGRIFFMLIESTSSREEMQASLSTAFRAFGADVEAELEVSSFKSLNDLKIKVIAYGGDAEGNFELAGESSVEAIADKLAKSTDILSGLPLSYVVRSIETPDQIVGTSLATEYDIVECELKGLLPTAAYMGLVDLFEDGIGAVGNIKASTIVVYNKAGNKYALYNVSAAEVLGIFDLNDPNGPMGVTDLEEVGAIVKFSTGSSNDVVFVFNGDGLKMQILNFNHNLIDQNVLPDGPIGTYENEVLLVNNFFSENNNFLFAGNGIDAAVRLPESFMIFDSYFSTRSLLFSTNGSEFSQILKLANKSISNLWKQSNSEFPGTGGPLFDSVGAGARIYFGNGTEQLLFINDTGDKMMYWEGRPSGSSSNWWLMKDISVDATFSDVGILN